MSATHRGRDAPPADPLDAEILAAVERSPRERGRLLPLVRAIASLHAGDHDAAIRAVEHFVGRGGLGAVLGRLGLKALVGVCVYHAGISMRRATITGFTNTDGTRIEP